MSLDCEVGMWLVGFWQLFAWWLVGGLWLEEAGHFRVGMQLGLEGLTVVFWWELVLEGPEMGWLLCSWSWKSYLDVQMVLEWLVCLCVWVQCVVCCGNMFCFVLQLCSCEVLLMVLANLWHCVFCHSFSSVLTSALWGNLWLPQNL